MHWITSISILLGIYAIAGATYTLVWAGAGDEGPVTLRFWAILMAAALAGVVINEARRRKK